MLTDARIDAMIKGVRDVVGLKDPVGQKISRWIRPNGLEIQKVRVPIGVIGIIYESRPNVTADAAALCFKTSNAVILRGGKEALHSNRPSPRPCRPAARRKGLPDPRHPARRPPPTATPSANSCSSRAASTSSSPAAARASSAPSPNRRASPSSSTTRASATSTSTPAPTRPWR
jgi:hypothetical protein